MVPKSKQNSPSGIIVRPVKNPREQRKMKDVEACTNSIRGLQWEKNMSSEMKAWVSRPGHAALTSGSPQLPLFDLP